MHHLTLRSPLGGGEAYGLLHFFNDRLELHGPRLADLLPGGGGGGGGGGGKASSSSSTFTSVGPHMVLALAGDATGQCSAGLSQRMKRRQTLPPYQRLPTKRPKGDAPASGPHTIYLLRHGESEANATGADVPDPPLTELGRRQAATWRGAIEGLGIKAVLVSPLRRAIESFACAFGGAGVGGNGGVDVPTTVCPAACELHGCGGVAENTPRPPSARHPIHLESSLPPALLQELARNTAGPSARQPVQADPEDSILQLQQVLMSQAEGVVLLVTHWGVIQKLTGVRAKNAALVECTRCQETGALTVVRTRDCM